jgi:para-aminobenzoate synthetase component 1
MAANNEWVRLSPYLCHMNTWIETESNINSMASLRTPFFFAFDFDGHDAFALPLSQIDPEHFLFNIAGITNATNASKNITRHIRFEHKVLDQKVYRTAFDKVMYHLQRGDSYLLNLTFPVEINTNLGAREIFQRSNAPYKLWLRDRFVVFSPESFITISNNQIHTFPMKGTISAHQPDAERLLLSNSKELAEHYTIVDLMRNDLSMVATKVRVERFRYVDAIQTLNGKLLQTSSHITGILPNDWHCHLGSLLIKLLPAGSVSGAPKKRTTEIIREAEMGNRGFYTGVMGLFDGRNLYSAVMIRFIEQKGNQMLFRAGGGITVNSNWLDEYNELLQKIVLPFGNQTEVR